MNKFVGEHLQRGRRPGRGRVREEPGVGRGIWMKNALSVFMENSRFW